jgi:hypothetical protein
MKQSSILNFIAVSLFSCISGNSVQGEDGLALTQEVKYENTLDKHYRVLESRKTLIIYSKGKDVGSEFVEANYYEYDSFGNMILEKSFEPNGKGKDILKYEITHVYNEKGMLKSSTYKKDGVVLDSSIQKYDENGRLKIVANFTLLNRPKDQEGAMSLATSRNLAYDTSFLYKVYEESGLLKMEKLLDNNSQELSTNHYVYRGNELRQTYRIGNNNDTLEKHSYEAEKDGSVKETLHYTGIGQSTIWKKGDKVIKEVNTYDGRRSVSKYFYDKHWNLLVERIYL